MPRALQELTFGTLPWLRDAVMELALEPADATFVLEVLARPRRTNAALDAIAAHCREVLGR